MDPCVTKVTLLQCTKWVKGGGTVARGAGLKPMVQENGDSEGLSKGNRGWREDLKVQELFRK